MMKTVIVMSAGDPKMQWVTRLFIHGNIWLFGNWGLIVPLERFFVQKVVRSGQMFVILR